ncbi:hypothetical protein Thu_254 [Bacillus phage Thurquoise]|nr:hypothetical protein Thu_10 [Bacillus phage Thurquoise]UXQ89097.1 hypothetical protein Thu_254 [Bacillus phage Thurquoise]
MIKGEKAVFSIDGFEGQVFEGFANVEGGSWNGFDIPYFPKYTVNQILARILNDWKNGQSYVEPKVWYTLETDTFSIVLNVDEMEDVDESKGMDIEVNGRLERVYCIGAFSWNWSKEEEEGQND